MALLDHDHSYTQIMAPKDIRVQRINCVEFGLFWLGFFALVCLANYLLSVLSF